MTSRRGQKGILLVAAIFASRGGQQTISSNEKERKKKVMLLFVDGAVIRNSRFSMDHDKSSTHDTKTV